MEGELLSVPFSTTLLRRFTPTIDPLPEHVSLIDWRIKAEGGLRMVLSGSKIAPLMYDCQSDTAARGRFVPINADEHVDTVHPNLSVAAAQLLETMPVSRLFDDLFQLSDFLLDFP